MRFISNGSSKCNRRKEEIEVTVTAKKGKFKVAVRKCAAVTEPEKKIREKKKLEELANGAKNNN